MVHFVHYCYFTITNLLYQLCNILKKKHKLIQKNYEECLFSDEFYLQRFDPRSDLDQFKLMRKKTLINQQ